MAIRKLIAQRRYRTFVKLPGQYRCVNGMVDAFISLVLGGRKNFRIQSRNGPRLGVPSNSVLTGS